MLITEVLGELARPYAYPPATTAYNFAQGWVEVVYPDMEEIVEQHLLVWAQEKLALGDEERLDQAFSHITYALMELRTRKKSGK